MCLNKLILQIDRHEPIVDQTVKITFVVAWWMDGNTIWNFVLPSGSQSRSWSFP